MAVMATHISWTNSTWNPTTGCTAVSAGCDNCYARVLTNRLFGGNFETVKLHPNRIAQVYKFRPLLVDGRSVPRMVFVNSMSDLMHEQIPDAFRDDVFRVMEEMDGTVFQVLTKRPMTLRRYIEARYKSAGVPAHIWLGVSVEDNRVAGRIGQLRRLKDAVGSFTAFLSVEPLIGMPDRHDYSGIEWVLLGGESGPNARDCEPDWLRCGVDAASTANAAVWFKQFGKWTNNPLYRAAAPRSHTARIAHAVAAGEKLPNEKGGATLDGKTYRQLPPSFAAIGRRLNPTLV